MANINSMFKVEKTGDQEVVVRFPKGIKIGDNLDASTLLKGMLELALHEEPDVEGQKGTTCTPYTPWTCTVQKGSQTGCISDGADNSRRI